MTPGPTPTVDRFRPRAARTLGGMFDDVSERYDLLNRVMSLGQDHAWRAAMWREVSEEAHAVLDLCTGSGVSLPGLRRPGRLVLGVDVSLRMLEIAAHRQGHGGWAPRLVCADGFRLPLPPSALDAVTIAFGIRNLRPIEDALAELARVLRPGGRLVVLEAAAPAPGPFAAFHGFYLRHLIPLAGRLSEDPTAYAYLSRSIFEFGAGPEFEGALVAAGFRLRASRRFLLGATRLWVAERKAGTDQESSQAGGNRMQNARSGVFDGVKVPSRSRERAVEWRIWTGIQMVLSLALTVALLEGLRVLVNSGADLPLGPLQRGLALVLLGGGSISFGLRTVQLLARILASR